VPPEGFERVQPLAASHLSQPLSICGDASDRSPGPALHPADALSTARNKADTGKTVDHCLHLPVFMFLKSTAAAAAPGSEESKPKGFVAKQVASLKSLLTPFSDPAVNARLVSLCVASALCSVATLIHDTYLPIYLSEQLGLSNTKVGGALRDAG